MNFFQTLESLQQKSPHEKKLLLILSVAILMGIIISVWLSLPSGSSSDKNAAGKNKANTAQTVGPFELLKEEIKKAIQAAPSSEDATTRAEIQNIPPQQENAQEHTQESPIPPSKERREQPFMEEYNPSYE